MNYNPYAAPQALPPGPPAGPPPPFGGRNQPWSIGEVISAAFEAFKSSWGVLIGSLFVFGFCVAPFSLTPIILQTAGVLDSPTVYMGFSLISGYVVVPIIESFLLGGMVRILLNIVRGQPTSVGDLFSGVNVFLSMLGVIFLNYVMLIFGCCFGGVALLGMGLTLASFFVVDQSMGTIAAMKAAWAATEGQRADVFLFSLATGGLYIAGAFLCGVGALVTAPVAALAWAILYVRLTGRGGPASVGDAGGFSPPGYGPPPGPPGGFGGPPPGPPGYGGGGYGPPGGGGYGPPGGYGGPQS